MREDMGNEDTINIEDKDVVLVALGCEHLDKPVAGSLIRNCDDCNTEVWIAKSWQGKKIDKIICVDCYEKKFGRNSNMWEDEIDMAITEEQIKEYNDYHKKKYGYTVTNDEIIKMLEIKFKRKIILKNNEEQNG